MHNKGTERYANFTVRVPAASLETYVNAFEEHFNVVQKTINSNDVTDIYFDVKSRMNSLVTQEERLLSMLEGATELEYMLKLEEALANVRYRIENNYSSLNRYDSQVEMSTVIILLQEVIEYKDIVETPKTCSERLILAVKNSWKNFVDGWKDFSIELVYMMPSLILLAVFVVVIVMIIRKSIKKKRRNKTNGDNISNRYKKDESIKEIDTIEENSDQEIK